MRHRQLAAIVAVVVGTATLVLGAVLAVSQFPRGLGVLACVLIAGACAWYGVVRRGIARTAGLAGAVLALGGAIALVAIDGLLAEAIVIAGLLIALAAARIAIAVHVSLPSAALRGARSSSTTRARAGERPSASPSRKRRGRGGSSRSS